MMLPAFRDSKIPRGTNTLLAHCLVEKVGILKLIAGQQISHTIGRPSFIKTSRRPRLNGSARSRSLTSRSRAMRDVLFGNEN